MKTTDRIPLATTGNVVNEKGEPMPETRTVKQEIERLRYAGYNDAADRLERACEDPENMDDGLPAINPVTGKEFTKTQKEKILGGT